MGVRVRVLLKVGDKVVETSALANAGFESDELDVVLPFKLARRLGLLEGKLRAEYVEVDTAGGPQACVYLRGVLELKLVLTDRETKAITCNVLINPRETEVLLSDAVLEELGIEILSPRSGVWRLRDDEPSLKRRSAKPEYW